MNRIHLLKQGASAQTAGEHATDLRQMDLNLLVAFDALAQEGSVTRAAGRLGITQSAMSHTLRRLRELLSDPVVVRAGAGIALTPRSEALVLPIRGALIGLRHILTSPAQFEARTSQRQFRIAAPDLLELRMLPLLHQAIACKAPSVSLAVCPLSKNVAAQLETGELDVAVVPALVGSDAPFSVSAASHLTQTTLLRDRFRGFLYQSHPLAGRRRLTLKRYLSLSHLLVSPSGSGPGLVDSVLKDQDLHRRVAVRVPSFAGALALLQDSELILTAPAELASAPCALGRVVSVELPLTLPEHTVNLVWHPRFGSEPAHRWLRQLIGQVLGVKTP